MRLIACENRPWEGRAILHVDLDAFFAAVEQLDHPEWRGKPVIVGGDPGKRGVVSTCSYEARAFGVRSAMSSARAAQLCPDAIWTHGSFDRYREMSLAVRAIFADETPRFQPVSIDEAYLDVTPGRFTSEHPVAIARRIRARVAELGNHLLGRRLGGQVGGQDRERPRQAGRADGRVPRRGGARSSRPCRFAPCPASGPRRPSGSTAWAFERSASLAALDDVTADEVLGSHGIGLVARARGLDVREVHDNDPVKSVSNERTFATDVRSPDEVDGALAALAAKVGQRLRRKGLSGTNRQREVEVLGLHDQDGAPHAADPDRRRCGVRRGRARARPPGVVARESGCACSEWVFRASTTRRCSSICSAKTSPSTRSSRAGARPARSSCGASMPCARSSATVRCASGASSRRRDARRERRRATTRIQRDAR